MEENYGITAENLERVRGRLIAASGRRLSWKAFARIASISPNTISNILNGRTHGSIRTARAIMRIAPQFGAVIELDDLVTQISS